MKAEKGKLFGSVTAKDIAVSLKKEGFDISEKSVEFKPTKELGEKESTIMFEFGITARISVSIKAE
ncbi:MAG: hypothetical protein ACD_15C00041G0001 [uncultured bacterium]|nr:MAG: hypothetical protein ACD_15C00041G0001 [uncultured bacterium]